MHNFEKQWTMCTNIISAFYHPLVRCVLTNKQTNERTLQCNAFSHGYILAEWTIKPFVLKSFYI
jgi:hypothetical protein